MTHGVKHPSLRAALGRHQLISLKRINFDSPIATISKIPLGSHPKGINNMKSKSSCAAERSKLFSEGHGEQTGVLIAELFSTCLASSKKKAERLIFP